MIWLPISINPKNESKFGPDLRTDLVECLVERKPHSICDNSVSTTCVDRWLVECLVSTMDV